MISFEEYKKLALSFPETSEIPHFDKPSFRYMNKIFGTYWKDEHKAMLKLSLVDQDVFCSIDKEIFYPVPGGWGKQGATFVNLKKAGKKIFKDAITCSYNSIIKKKSIVKNKLK